MTIPTEPIGSIPRPQELMDGVRRFTEGRMSKHQLEALYQNAVRDTIERFEGTNSPVITDGEQSKPSFATYPIHALHNIVPGGVTVAFADGHTRQLPRLTGGPFQFGTYASYYLDEAKKYAKVPVKQAVISISMLSLLYPGEEIPGYSKKEFMRDLLNECVVDIRMCLQKGAHNVQIDFTEGRLALKLDPSGQLLKIFLDLNNQVLDRFSADERKRIGVHTCPGGDQDSTHSADVDYAKFIPEFLQLSAGNFYFQLTSEKDRPGVLQIIRDSKKPDQMIFVGVTNPISSQVETPEEVKAHVLEAARFIPLDRLGTTDDCGFSPFGDDTSTSRDIAFDKIRARVAGTEMAAAELGA